MSTERGEVSAEAVIIVPVVFLFLLLGVQVAALFHAANIATAAAAQGAAAAAAFGGSGTTGERLAVMAAVEMGGKLHESPVVVLQSETVQVSVSIAIPRIIPGFPVSVERRIVEPRELFVGEDDR
jgi:hypothetical protein